MANFGHRAMRGHGERHRMERMFPSASAAPPQASAASAHVLQEQTGQGALLQGQFYIFLLIDEYCAFAFVAFCCLLPACFSCQIINRLAVNDTASMAALLYDCAVKWVVSAGNFYFQSKVHGFSRG